MGAQRLYVVDSSNPAVRVVELETGRISKVINLPGFRDPTGGDDNPYGLALEDSYVDGIEVIHNAHEYERYVSIGRYFFFIMPAGLSQGQYTALHYRNGVLLWKGHIQIFSPISEGKVGCVDGLVREQRPNECPQCNAVGRWDKMVETDVGQWRLGDIVHIPKFHTPSRQMLYTAEGYNGVI